MVRAKRRCRRWPLKLALALASTSISLLIAELAIRAFGGAPAVRAMWVSRDDCVYKRSLNPLLSIELKANYRADDPDLTTTYEFTNAHGLRDRERAVPKPQGVRRILLLGDSVVEGHGIAQSHTISHQWESLYLEGMTEVLNFGVSSYITRSEVELLEVKGLQFEPDVVVLIFVENDYLNFIVEGFPLTLGAHRPEWSKHLFVHSDLFRLLSIHMNLYGCGIDADPLARNRGAVGENNVVDGLARLRELAVEHGFEPLVAVWPHFENAAIADSVFMPDGGGELVIERLARISAPSAEG